MRIGIVTLGCSKNSVDSEVLASNLLHSGFEVKHEYDKSDVVIINTCGFIADAKEQSIDTILTYGFLRKKRKIKKLIVMGCLSERYMKDLEIEIPEVDAWFGVLQWDEVVKYLNESFSQYELINRELSTPKHYAYLKISEGCDRTCSFCAIPMIRGKHISREMDSLIDEARLLAQKGVKELIVIAQDITTYGIDVYKKQMLAPLLESLVKIDGIEWIRLHYAYPSTFPDDVLELMAKEEKICKYIDIPFQHINEDILHKMRRGHKRDSIEDFVERTRKLMPNIAIRSTFIVGFPSETDDDFRELLDFIKSAKLDRVGAFTYSEEEGTTAAQLENSVSDEAKIERLEEFMAVQQEISWEKNQSFVGQKLKVIIDDFEDGVYIARTEFDSPEVDNIVLVSSEKPLNIGEFYTVSIISADYFELDAEVV